jgi:hypothetical protein
MVGVDELCRSGLRDGRHGGQRDASAECRSGGEKATPRCTAAARRAVIK